MTYPKSLLSIIIITGHTYASQEPSYQSIAIQTEPEFIQDRPLNSSTHPVQTPEDYLRTNKQDCLDTTDDIFIASENEQRFAEKRTNENRIIVLSMEGGGMRVFATLEFLKYLEQRSRRHTTEIFNLMAGTSAGGQIATLLNIKDKKTGKARYWAKDLLEYYKTNLPNAFETKGGTLFGLLGEKYKTTPFRKIYQELVGDTQFNELLNPTFVTAYDLSPKAKKLKVFSSIEDEEISALDVMLATAAAPSYFKSHQVGDKHYADGGLIMQNPILLAQKEARKLFPNATSIVILSLGTGVFPDQEDNLLSLRHPSLLSIARNLPEYFLEGQKNAMDVSMSQSTDTIYIKLDPIIRGKKMDLDDTSESSIARLSASVLDMIGRQDLEIRQLLSYFPDL
jgi:patatin-like phospholipase/acyl hydrolase